jgi:transcriptional regulator with XRE-family HTH domain
MGVKRMGEEVRLLDLRQRRLRALMAEAGFRGVSHLAEVLGQKHSDLAVNRATLSRLLSGSRPRPNIHLMHAVAREFGVTLDQLYELVAPVDAERPPAIVGGGGHRPPAHGGLTARSRCSPRLTRPPSPAPFRELHRGPGAGQSTRHRRARSCVSRRG